MLKTVTVFCLLLSIVGKSQSYIPLLGEDKQWDIGVFNAEQCSSCCNWYGYSIQFSNDTLIEGVPFKRFDTYEVDGPGNPFGICPPYENTTDPYYVTHYFREDTVSQKVWWYDEGIERLIYDFNLDVGDIVAVHDLCCEQEMTVLEIDNIITDDGISRRRIFLDGWAMPVWVEGIGNINQGLEYHIEGFGEGTKLLCFKESGLALIGEDCDNYVGIGEFNGDEVYTLFPNPMSSSAVLHLGDIKGPLTMEIYDLQGKLIRSEQQTTSNKQLVLERGELASGSYILRIVSEQDGFELPFIIR
jgi:hypothetical protein